MTKGWGMSKTVANIIQKFAGLATSFMKPNRRALTLALASERLVQVHRLSTAKGDLAFCCPSARALHDPLNFFKDEPETIRWIDVFVKDGDIFWDIGANIGIYTLYAALNPNITVLAFEPGAASFGALVKNVELNGMGDRVQTYCLAFDETTHLDFLHMANTVAGGSMHAFGQLDTVEGRIEPVFSQAAPGFSIDDFRRMFGVRQPDHVKLDVDGIEEKILRGGEGALKGVKTVLVELVGAHRERMEGGPSAVLAEYGFRQAGDFNKDTARNWLFVNSRLGGIP